MPRLEVGNDCADRKITASSSLRIKDQEGDSPEQPSYFINLRLNCLLKEELEQILVLNFFGHRHIKVKYQKITLWAAPKILTIEHKISNVTENVHWLPN